MYSSYMFWLGSDGDQEMKHKDGIIEHRNSVLREVLTELNKLRSHSGRVTWRDIVESVERLKI